MPMANTPVGDEVEDDHHKGGLVDHLMLQVGLLQMNLMEMSTGHLEIREDLDDPDVVVEGMTWRTVMSSIPMMTMSAKMDRLSSLLPGVDDGPQASCALLPCEIGRVILDFQF